MLGEDVSPAELLQARSPSLDLDSLYGAGPGNPASAKFYEADGLHLKVGHDRRRSARTPPSRATTCRAVDRATAASEGAHPDPRNDENLTVAQTHLAMIRFHNRVVDTPRPPVPPAQRFRTARKHVTLHYQWMLRHDYLPRICDPAVVDDVFNNGRKAVRAGRRADRRADDADRVLGRGVPARPQHGPRRLQLEPPTSRRRPGTLFYLFDFSGARRQPRRRARGCSSNWIADLRRLYDFTEAASPSSRRRGGPTFNRAMRIDTLLDRPAAQPAARHVRRPVDDPVQRPARQPGVPQPHPGQDGQARHRPADGARSSRTRASTSRR